LLDIREKECSPRLPVGTDLWDIKEQVDVVVQGSAFAPNGKAVNEMTASVQVGSRLKQVAVLGHRNVKWVGNEKVEIESPEPFEEIPLTYKNAYGG
jgi:hypothetical protein